MYDFFNKNGIYFVLLIFFCSKIYAQGDPWFILDQSTYESEGRFLCKADELHFYNLGNFRTQINIADRQVHSALPGKSAFVTMVDIEGDLKWLHAFEATNQFKIERAASNASGNLFLLATVSGLCSYRGTILSDSADKKEPYLIVLSNQGSILNSIKLNENGNELKVKGFDVSYSGKLLLLFELKDVLKIAGKTYYKQGNESILILIMDSNGQIIADKIISTQFKIKPESCVFTNGDGVAITGEFEGIVKLSEQVEMLGPSKSYFIVSMSDQLHHKWHHSNIYGAKGFSAKTLKADNDGNIIVAGEFSNTLRINDHYLIQSISGKSDVLIIKYDVSGNLLWFDHVNPIEQAKPIGVSIDKLNDIYLIGEYRKGFIYGYKQGNPVVSTCTDADKARGAFIAKYGADGQLKGAKSISGVNECKISAIFIDFKNDIYITGSYKGQLALDTLEILLAPGFSDSYYLARIDMHQCGYIYDNSKDFINKDIIFLHQNFPNPTSGTTFFHFHTAKEIDVELSIYDATGRKIENVISFSPSEVRNYVIPYTFPEHVNNGIYFLVITGNNQRIIKRIVLNR